MHTDFRYITWLTFRSHSDRLKIVFNSRRYSFMKISKVSDALTGRYANITIAKTLVILNTVREKNVATLVYNPHFQGLLVNFVLCYCYWVLEYWENVGFFFFCASAFESATRPQQHHNNLIRSTSHTTQALLIGHEMKNFNKAQHMNKLKKLTWNVT